MQQFLAALMIAISGPSHVPATAPHAHTPPAVSVAAASSSVPLPHDRPSELDASSSEPEPAPVPSSSAAEPSASEPASDAVPLPRDRPDASAASSEPASSESSSVEPSSSVSSSTEPPSSAEPASSSAEPAPPPPPPRDYQVACPAVMNGDVTGKSLPPIHEGQCGIQSPLSIEAVTANGRSIPLNAAVITDCGMATAFPAWIAEVDNYLKAHDKTEIKTINLSTSYQCRNVNHAATGNLSFHGFADALDVMGFDLADGRTISIAPGYKGTPEQGSEILHFAHDSACAHFMTVLGPDADAEHQDNMHVDLACHGKSCVSRLCQ